MKLVIAIYCTLFLFLDIDINEVRTLYKATDGSIEQTNKLKELLITVDNNDKPELLAYKGAVTAVSAKFEQGVKNKMTVFEEGTFLIENAIKIDSLNIEVRFVRLSVQQNSPKLLDYHTDIEKDKQYIFNNLKRVKSTSLKEYIKGYVLYSKKFSEEEKILISNQ